MDNVIPILTGRVESHEEYWHRQHQRVQCELSEEWTKRLKAERERDAALDRLDDYVEAIAEGRLVGTVRYWVYGAWCAVGLFVGHILTRAML